MIDTRGIFEWDPSMLVKWGVVSGGLVVSLLFVGCCFDGRGLPRDWSAPSQTAQHGPPAPRPVMVPLAATISSCHARETGLFGGRWEVTATVTNDDVEAGTFTIQYLGAYPGGGEQNDGSTSVELGPRQTSTVQFSIRPAEGLQGGTCRLIAPQVQRWR